MQQKLTPACNFMLLLILVIGLQACKNENVDKVKEQYNDPAAAEWLADYKEPQNKWGYIDTKGNVLVEIKYDDVRDFKNGIAIVNYKGKWGYIDAKGSEIIKPSFLDAHEFDGNLALVQSFDKKYFYIDRTGKKQFDCPAMNCADFKKGYALFNENGVFGIVDSMGKVTCQLTFTDISPLESGKFIAQEGNYFGIADYSGKWLVSPKYTLIKAPANGFTRCKKDNKYYFLNNELKEKLGPFDDATDFEDGHAAIARGGKYEIIDQNGKSLYQSSNPLTAGGEGKWVLHEGEKSIFIDTKGNKLYNQTFDNVYKFKDGIAGIQSGQGWGYIDKDGNTIVPAELPIIWDSKDGIIRFVANTGYGFMDTKGKILIAPKYIEARDFSEGKARVSVISE